MDRRLVHRAVTGLMWAAGVALAPAAQAAAPPTPRAQIQHLLRRFAFSASPADVSTVLAEGSPAWLAQQLNWGALDDSGSTLESLPTTLNAGGGYDDGNVFERTLMQHLMLTPRQLQAKLELHWLDHFAVSLAKVGDQAIMMHYEQTVRANALGNFATLLTAVAHEPAMLIWLDNNNNTGGAPNENFAREIMQLFTTGVYQLNMDGTQKLDGNGLALANYTQADVQAIAEAMTGYGVFVDYTNMNPQTRFSVQFTPANHYAAPLSFLGRSRPVPASASAIDFVAGVLAAQPSTAPFMAKELLQRFATETPSPQFVSDIATVWANTQTAPDQIAQVVTAIVNHPEFTASYQGMLKQPVEFLVGALRQLPGVLQASSTATPGNTLLWELNGFGQQLFFPPSVFSFYTPGNLSATINSNTRLYRTGIFANTLVGVAGQAYVDTFIDIPTLRARAGSGGGWAIARYLMDALVDGGNLQIQDKLVHFMGDQPDDDQIRGAMWLLLNSPDYAVN